MNDSTTGYKAGRHAITGQMADAYGISISANPNPASSWVSFNYALRDEKSKAVIEVSDVAGRVVASLNVHGKQGQKVLDTREIHAGAYIYTLKTEGFVKSGKLIINK